MDLLLYVWWLWCFVFLHWYSEPTKPMNNRYCLNWSDLSQELLQACSRERRWAETLALTMGGKNRIDPMLIIGYCLQKNVLMDCFVIWSSSCLKHCSDSELTFSGLTFKADPFSTVSVVSSHTNLFCDLHIHTPIVLECPCHFSQRAVLISNYKCVKNNPTLV